MGVRILVGKEQGCDDEIACLFCSTGGVAFGPIFRDGEEQAEGFLEWLGCDPRKLSMESLTLRFLEFQDKQKVSK